MSSEMLASLMTRLKSLPEHNGLVKLRDVEDAVLDAYNEQEADSE